VADAWSASQLLALDVAFDVIFLDIGGISSFDGTLESLALVRQLQAIFKPSLRVIVCKSKCLQDISNRYVAHEAPHKSEAAVAVKLVN